MELDVVTMGEVMGTIRLRGDFGVGNEAGITMSGAEGNVAIALARLKHNVQWVGTLGNDTFGEGILRTLRGERVYVDFVERSPVQTGLLVVRGMGSEAKRVDYHRKCSAGSLFSPEQIERAIAAKPKIVHITGITPSLSETARKATLAMATKAKEAGILVSFDINYRSRLWSREEATPVLQEIAHLADIVIGGTEEYEILSTHADPIKGMDATLRHGAKQAVWKTDNLARVMTSEGLFECPNKKVRVVDPIGAGDAFVSGYLSGFLDGLDPVARLRRAHIMGGILVASDGDWEALPLRRELETLESLPGNAWESGEVLR
ncbi:sugar kinase [Trueperella bialowiezensis]|uniref:5-dehydro-2-deoxygluconokinase n=1 Tax=Trueperella bialowiezensis TaxID=312285 RepID=A0A3S4X6D2_9ACTO|nr:sugar kinase [Trueperella bialowiezensis]VEI13618.1 5-dehydro-2-deoxygluconokinase [Trueperella bialowiezensis]